PFPSRKERALATKPIFQVRSCPRRKLPPTIEVFLVDGDGLLAQCREVLPLPPDDMFGHDGLFETLRRFEEEVLHIEYHEPDAVYREVAGYDELEELLKDLLKPPPRAEERMTQLRDELVRTMLQRIRENVDPEGSHYGLYL